MSRLRYLIPLVAACLLVGSMLRPAYAANTRSWVHSSSSSKSSSSSSAASSVKSEPETASGAVVDPLTAAWMKLNYDRNKRIENFHSNVLLFKKKERPYLEGIDVFYTKRAELREQCRIDLRKANRDGKFSVLLHCYRAELTQYHDYLKRQYDYYEEVPGPLQRVRRESLVVLKELSDAVDAITYAIDSDVYTTADELMEAKKNLREKYQVPAWEALSRLRADRNVTWIGYLLSQFPAASEEDAVLGGVRPEWTTIRTCLMQSELKLRSIVDGDPLLFKRNLLLASPDLQSCLQSLRDLPPPMAETGTGEVIPMP